jgi:hypothetical protein
MMRFKRVAATAAVFVLGVGTVFAQTTTSEATAPTEPKRASDRGKSSVTFDFVLNALPASILIDTSSDKFEVTGTGGSTKLSTVYIMPNINAGIGMAAKEFYFDLTAGAGLVINDTFRSYLFDVLASASYAPSESFKLGPHAGLIRFTDPTWLDEDGVSFGDTWGWLLGLQLSMGDRILYLVSVDYIGASFDVNADHGITVNRGDLDWSGLAVQFGVRGEF